MSENNTLELAMEWAKSHKPNAPTAHKCAFANCVEHLVEGYVGGYGGPSVRQYALDYVLMGTGDRAFLQTMTGDKILVMFPDGKLPPPGEWKFEEALAFCEPICFGPLTSIHRMAWEEQGEISFDNDPQDLIELEGK